MLSQFCGLMAMEKAFCYTAVSEDLWLLPRLSAVHLNLLNLSFSFKKKIVCVCVWCACVCVPWCLCGSQRTTCRTQFSLSTMKVLMFELRPLILVASTHLVNHLVGP